MLMRDSRISIIHQLQSRIQSLEQQSSRPAHLSSTYSTSSPHHHGENVYNQSPSYSTSDAPGTTVSSSAVNAFTGAATGEPQNEGFHGASSAASFMYNVRNAIEGRVPADLTTGIVPAAPQGQRTTSKRLDYVLPPRKSADELLECYWRFVYPLYPLIDQQKFGQIYNCLWNGAPLPESSSYIMRLDEEASVATLNLALALGCQYRLQNEVGESHTAAEMFFSRAHSAVKFDPTDTSNTSVQVVQVMLLMAQYLIGTGNTHKAWGVIGMALRGCHHLGLHRDITYKNVILDIKDREFAKRIYHACLMLER